VCAGLHRISDTHPATLEYPGRDAAMTTHRVVATRPQILLHARAGMAISRAFEHGIADTKEKRCQSTIVAYIE
jgi:hypothetical protein